MTEALQFAVNICFVICLFFSIWINRLQLKINKFVNDNLFSLNNRLTKLEYKNDS